MVSPDFETAGGRLYYIRMIRGLSQPALSKNASVSYAAISCLERNITKGRAETWGKLSDALNIPPAWFLFGVGEIPE